MRTLFYEIVHIKLIPFILEHCILFLIPSTIPHSLLPWTSAHFQSVKYFDIFMGYFLKGLNINFY